jgi:fructose-specific component phosphotransferase system IIB-like protein
MRGNKGISLITVVVIIIVMIIIASLSIIQGNKVVLEARAHKKATNLIAVETAVGRIRTKLSLAQGDVIPEDVKLVGTKDPIIDSEENIIATGWYLLDEQALSELGIEKDDDGYLVNYYSGQVIIVSDGINKDDFIPDAPLSIDIAAMSTTHSITATGYISGPIGRVKECYFKIDSGGWIAGSVSEETTYIFDNLTQNTEYSIDMKIVDVDNNEVEAENIFVTTKQIPNEGIEIFESPAIWTNGTVSITIGWPGDIDNLTREYSFNNSTWSLYSNTFTISNNCTIYARLKDITGQSGTVISKVITNIDKVMPTVNTPSGTSTTNSITVTLNQTDSLSGINQTLTRYAIKKASDSTYGNWQASNSFTYLIKNTSYNIKSRVTDNAGNTQESQVLTINTLDISSNISFVLSTTSWTNANVAVTIVWPSDTTGLTKQYSMDGTTWNIYASPITVSTNQTVYARLIDSTQQVGSSANINITNIDKILPSTIAPTATAGTTDITVTSRQTDANSGINTKTIVYAIKPSGGSYGAWQSSNIFTGLSTYTTYSVKTRVTDNAGNTTESAEYTLTTVCSHPSFIYSNYNTINHKKTCTLCGYFEYQAHSYGSWSSYDNSQHRRKCSKCSRYDYAYHDWELLRMDGQYFIYYCDICGRTYRTLVGLE